MKRIVLTAMIVLTAIAARAQETTLLGEGNDGNRSATVHLIELFDAEGKQIRAADKDPQPFSMKQTCGKCHDYDKISGGWHFNANKAPLPGNRPGQPWMLVDAVTRTQLPLSGRAWPGTFTPEQAGLTSWDFMNRFGSHFPGGSYGEMDAEKPEHAIRQGISGKYEVNCLTCHSADPRQDQSLTALQLARQNYRWAAAAASGMAIVNGTASALSDYFDPEFDEGIKVTYKDGTFDKDNMVFFDVGGKPLDQRCYFCHSTQDLRVDEHDEWMRDKDVHSMSGLNCTDCHRNGGDHMISRGDEETQGNLATLSCKGCHLGVDGHRVPDAGRLGAPMPRHAGIPPIHFEKMNCTACHSGTWPQETPGRVRTAQIHKLGLHGKHKLDLRLPHVYAPILLKGGDGKIGAYSLVWPAFWATLEGEKVVPIPTQQVLEAARATLSAEVERQDDWRPLTEEQVAKVLGLLQEKLPDAQPVYIAGGKLYQLTNKGGVQASAHPAAGAYVWPIAHDVRPAEQSLGVRGCADCHTADSAFFFAEVEIDSPIQGDKQTVKMTELQGVDRLYMWVFNVSFVFRPMLKVVAIMACGLIALVVLIYGLKALVAISRACTREAE